MSWHALHGVIDGSYPPWRLSGVSQRSSDFTDERSRGCAAMSCAGSSNGARAEHRGGDWSALHPKRSADHLDSDACIAMKQVIVKKRVRSVPRDLSFAAGSRHEPGCVGRTHLDTDIAFATSVRPDGSLKIDHLSTRDGRAIPKAHQNRNPGGRLARRRCASVGVETYLLWSTPANRISMTRFSCRFGGDGNHSAVARA